MMLSVKGHAEAETEATSAADHQECTSVHCFSRGRLNLVATVEIIQ